MEQPKPRTMPTQEQLRTWRSYIETAEALQARLAARLQSESSLSTGDYQVLLALSEAEQKTLRSSELATLVGWERSRLSHHLGRMEKRGLIARNACAEAVHGIDVQATDAGLETFRAGSVPHLRAVRELFLDAFSAEQLGQIGELTAALRRNLGLDDGAAR
ncbi:MULTISPECIES: MarR family transcriptional regulator [Arthrobacter]|uniref:MarR family transcriptional regulator n=2 Tax=Arthrobacter TaxID=1663 RepID=A0ABU9KMI0_9MICC|nr:MarR family transcriptional regulator [Arthrobacter sp. YJM1]MDP5227967.1 MarR family transcriptional regulator [Arthrobacter sp. YJM1]